MIVFDILSKDKPDKVLPSLFRILHSNMSVIAPTGDDFEKDYRIWIEAISHGLKQDARQIILIYDDAEIIGYFWGKSWKEVNKCHMKVEECMYEQYDL